VDGCKPLGAGGAGGLPAPRAAGRVRACQGYGGAAAGVNAPSVPVHVRVEGLDRGGAAAGVNAPSVPVHVRGLGFGPRGCCRWGESP